MGPQQRQAIRCFTKLQSADRCRRSSRSDGTQRLRQKYSGTCIAAASTSGRIIFQTQDVTQLSQKQLKPFRQQVQFISQRPESFFDPLLKLGASLREPLHIFDLPDSSEIIEAALATVKLSPALLDRYPHQVSGGEVQRLSIARALLLKPKLLILDEPTSMLDISVQAQILQLFKNIRRQEQMAFLFISHDKAVINYMCDRQLYMQEGRIT